MNNFLNSTIGAEHRCHDFGHFLCQTLSTTQLSRHSNIGVGYWFLALNFRERGFKSLAFHAME